MQSWRYSERNIFREGEREIKKRDSFIRVEEKHSERERKLTQTARGMERFSCIKKERQSEKVRQRLRDEELQEIRNRNRETQTERQGEERNTQMETQSQQKIAIQRTIEDGCKVS